MLITGDLIEYLGCGDNQVLDGFTNDPRGFLIQGDVYEADIVEQHGNRERVWLTGLEGAFDSSCFAIKNEVEKTAIENITVIENTIYVDDCYPSVSDIIIEDIIEGTFFGPHNFW